jgi:hypothetical protein
MLNWLRGKFGKKKANTLNLVNSDFANNSFTIMNKQESPIKEESLEEMRQNLLEDIGVPAAPKSFKELNMNLLKNRSLAESSRMSIEDAKSYLLKKVDELVLKLSEIENQTVISESDLETIHTAITRSKDLNEAKLAERRIKNANLRIDQFLER